MGMTQKRPIPRKRTRGVSLIELLVAMSLTLIIGLIATSIFLSSEKLLGVSSTSYLISRDFSLGVEQLRRSLKQTALGTIRVADKGLPSVSMTTPYDKDRKINLGSQGTPEWKGWEHYILKIDGQQKTGQLVRWSEFEDLLVPKASVSDPFTITDSSHEKVILDDVVRPGAQVSGLHTESTQLSDDDGFSVRFLTLVDGDYVSSAQNPAVRSSLGRGLEKNTRLVEVTLRTFSQSKTTGKSNTVGLKFRVAPRF